jgi:hypothetical protein
VPGNSIVIASVAFDPKELEVKVKTMFRRVAEDLRSVPPYAREAIHRP